MKSSKPSATFAVLMLSFLGLYLAGPTVLAQSKNNKAPAFTLNLLNGGELKSSELEGKLVVLKFKASW